jgi:hypothetical protein
MKPLLTMKGVLMWFSVGMVIGGCAASHTQTTYGEKEEEPSSSVAPQQGVPSPSTSKNYAKLWGGEYEGEGDVYLIRENRWVRDKRFELSIRELAPRFQGTDGLNINISGKVDRRGHHTGPLNPDHPLLGRAEYFHFAANVDNPRTINGDFRGSYSRAECRLTKEGFLPTDDVITGEITSYESYGPTAKYVFTVKRTKK